MTMTIGIDISKDWLESVVSPTPPGASGKRGSPTPPPATRR